MSLRAAAGPLAVASACLAALAHGAWIDPPVPPRAGPVVRTPYASPPARALLGDLREGDSLVGWRVLAIDGPHDGMLRIDLGRDRVRFALMVARRGRRPEPAPLETERYAIFYGHADPPGTALPGNTIRATTHALARRIRAHESDVDVPGL